MSHEYQDPPALRTRTSTRNAKVTLLSLEEPAPTTTPRKRAFKQEVDETVSGQLERTVSTPKKAKQEPQTSTRTPRRSARQIGAPAEEVEIEDMVATPASKPAKSPRPYTPTKVKLALDKPHPEPKNWRRQYELIEKMREKIVAPVDTL